MPDLNGAMVVYRPTTFRALFRRRGLLSDLEGTLRQLEREYARDVETIRQFERRYRPAVAEPYDKLQRLRKRINRGWEALGKARSGQAGEASATESDLEAESSSAPRPGNEARRLFLSLARLIHPDLATDDADRRRRHEMMAEATLAYRDNNERRLQWLLEHWEADSEPIVGLGLGALWSRTNRQIAWVRYRIREMQYSIGQLHSSPVARIMEQHDRGRTAGRNLILEMRRQIQAEFKEAGQEMDRLQAAIDDLDPTLQESVRAACRG